ncbi:MAG TPA: prepilin peptidase [Candidatus Saccharimonadales bacterium]|nr:prepilin peptidase [Candidatus Saccharimonadales bacterium]
MILIVCCLGLILGSFVNALVWRLHEQEEVAEALVAGSKRLGKPAEQKLRTRLARLSILRGRSMCPACGHGLTAKDLVPVISWLTLGGKCRYCHAPISVQYPVVELLTALLFVVSYIWWPLGWQASGYIPFILWLVFLTGFMALAVYDIRWMLLPDRIVYPLIVLAAVEVVMQTAFFHGGWSAATTAVFGAGSLAGLFYLLYLGSRGNWIGFGDVKLAIVLGLLVGGPLRALLVLFVASLLGSLIAIPLLARGRATAKTLLPFGPLLLTATVIVVLFGEPLVRWYTGLFI